MKKSICSNSKWQLQISAITNKMSQSLEIRYNENRVYDINFRPGLIRLRTHTNFPGVLKSKMETLVFSLPLKKSKRF